MPRRRQTPDCKKCAPGKLNNDKAETASKHDNENDCDVCPPGQISRLGDTYCFNCPAGWTNKSANASEPCAMCAPGRRSSANGRVCEACPTGQSNPTAGLSYCRPCLPGEFGNVSGLITCHKCPIGRAVNPQTLLYAQFVSAGRSSDSEGNAKCTLCGAGQYSNVKGEARARIVPKVDTVPTTRMIPKMTLQHAMIALKDTFRRTRVRRRVCHACQASLAMKLVSSNVTSVLRQSIQSVNSTYCSDCPTGYFQRKGQACVPCLGEFGNETGLSNVTSVL